MHCWGVGLCPKLCWTWKLPFSSCWDTPVPFLVRDETLASSGKRCSLRPVLGWRSSLPTPKNASRESFGSSGAADSTNEHCPCPWLFFWFQRSRKPTTRNCSAAALWCAPFCRLFNKLLGFGVWVLRARFPGSGTTVREEICPKQSAPKHQGNTAHAERGFVHVRVNSRQCCSVVSIWRQCFCNPTIWCQSDEPLLLIPEGWVTEPSLPVRRCGTEASSSNLLRSPLSCAFLCNLSKAFAQRKVGEVGLIRAFCCCNSVLWNRCGGSAKPAVLQDHGCCVSTTLPQKGVHSSTV